ncbi:MAG: hypothetical protein AAGD17_13655 [Bacteroidota bacterium]
MISKLGTPVFLGLSLIFLFAPPLLAQTNTFPASGNVGIGSTNPDSNLKVIGTTTIGGNWNPGNSIFTISDGANALIMDTNEIYGSTTIHIGAKGNNIVKFRSISDSGPAIDLMTILGDGSVGVGTTSPKGLLDLGKPLAQGQLGSVLARLSEGNTSGDGTYLGIRAYATQGSDISNIKSFALEHGFYGTTNSSISFFRGGGITGGFITFNTDTNVEKVRITKNGSVGIGTSIPDAKLTVKGNIHAEEVKVDLSVPGPDYVFKEDYDLKSLEEVQNYIRENGHLPNVPSAKDMEENGIQLGEMNMKLLEKIEELTLYILQLENMVQKIPEIEERLKSLEK